MGLRCNRRETTTVDEVGNTCVALFFRRAALFSCTDKPLVVTNGCCSFALRSDSMTTLLFKHQSSRSTILGRI